MWSGHWPEASCSRGQHAGLSRLGEGDPGNLKRAHVRGPSWALWLAGVGAPSPGSVRPWSRDGEIAAVSIPVLLPMLLTRRCRSHVVFVEHKGRDGEALVMAHRYERWSETE